MPRRKIAQLRDSVFRLVVNHGDGNHRGQAMRNSTRVKQVEAGMSLMLIDQAGRFMPWIDGRAVGSGLVLIRSMPQDVVKISIGGARPCLDLADGIADAVAWIAAAVRIAGIRGFCHQHAQVLDGNGHRRKFNRFRSTSSLYDGAGR